MGIDHETTHAAHAGIPSLTDPSRAATATAQGFRPPPAQPTVLRGGPPPNMGGEHGNLVLDACVGRVEVPSPSDQALRSGIPRRASQVLRELPQALPHSGRIQTDVVFGHLRAGVTKQILQLH